jgi:quercetin dioxygenase-like cupin family protein
MRKLPGLIIPFVAVGLLAGVNAALATPPSGQFSHTEHGRVQQTAGTITIPIADHLSATYTIAPGGSTGWRTTTGDTVLAVFKGILTVEQAHGCAGQEVPAGEAVVVPAGKLRLGNRANQPAEFSGMLFNLPAGGADPLVAGDAEPAPACAGFSAAGLPGGVSAAETARGNTSAHANQVHGGRQHAQSAGPGATSYGTVVHTLDASRDMVVLTYVLEPGFSTGWIVHTDEMAIQTKGTLAIYEPRDGKCQKVEEYHAGDAWAHKPHRHMGVAEGNEAAVIRIIGFNLPHGEPMPVFDSNLDHIDFTQPPPTDCPTRLR